MGVNRLQRLATQFRHNVRDIEGLRTKPRSHVRLFQMQCDPPPALCQRLSCERPFVVTVGVCAGRRQTRQRVAYLARHLVAGLDPLLSRMSPIVLTSSDSSTASPSSKPADAGIVCQKPSPARAQWGRGASACWSLVALPRRLPQAGIEPERSNSGGTIAVVADSYCNGRTEVPQIGITRRMPEDGTVTGHGP